MKKFALAAVVAFGIGGMVYGLTAPNKAEAAPDPVASIILSSSMPGVGEWYNSGFSGNFPLIECLVGSICPCVHLSSIIDAAAGRADDGMRFDFWGSPN